MSTELEIDDSVVSLDPPEVLFTELEIEGSVTVEVVESAEQGVPGAAGLSVLSGEGPPDPGEGRDGEFYLDTSSMTMYGPKDGVWGVGVLLASEPTIYVGPEPPPNPQLNQLWFDTTI
jgi:hypothetical protein